MNVCEYSPDATNIATGGEDGKVKVWEADSSFCFVTFSEHTGSISGLAFTQNGKAILSSSVDGTVRAFDLTRYRNFRTFTSPMPAQFSCVSVDSSGEIVAAGSFNVFDIFTWSMKTGRLIQVSQRKLLGIRICTLSCWLSLLHLRSAGLIKTYRSSGFSQIQPNTGK